MCNKCNNTKIMTLRFETGNNIQVIQVPCDCTRELSFIDPLEFPSFLDRVPCGMYGCKKLKPKSWTMCDDCFDQYMEDPDAFK